MRGLGRQARARSRNNIGPAQVVGGEAGSCSKLARLNGLGGSVRRGLLPYGISGEEVLAEVKDHPLGLLRVHLPHIPVQTLGKKVRVDFHPPTPPSPKHPTHILCRTMVENPAR